MDGALCSNIGKVKVRFPVKPKFFQVLFQPSVSSSYCEDHVHFHVFIGISKYGSFLYISIQEGFLVQGERAFRWENYSQNTEDSLRASPYINLGERSEPRKNSQVRGETPPCCVSSLACISRALFRISSKCKACSQSMLKNCLLHRFSKGSVG